MPVCRALGDGIYEVRTSLAQNRIARIPFYIDKKNRMVLLHGFMKKTRKTPKEDLENWPGATSANTKRNCNERKKKSEENRPQRVNLRQLSRSGEESERKSRRSQSSGCWRGNWNKPCRNSKRPSKRWPSSFIRAGHNWIACSTLRNVSVTLDTITRAARALGKRVIIRVADAKAAKRASGRITRPSVHAENGPSTQ